MGWVANQRRLGSSLRSPSSCPAFVQNILALRIVSHGHSLQSLTSICFTLHLLRYADAIIFPYVLVLEEYYATPITSSAISLNEHYPRLSVNASASTVQHMNRYFVHSRHLQTRSTTSTKHSSNTAPKYNIPTKSLRRTATTNSRNTTATIHNTSISRLHGAVCVPLCATVCPSTTVG